MTKQRKPSTRRRFKRRWPWIIAIVSLALLVLADRAGLLLVGPVDDLSRYDGLRVPVTNIISPHTLEIQIPDEVARRPATHVRLWGVTAPLPAVRDRAPEPFSDEAMALSHKLVDSQQVILRLESHRTRDTFNRLLAHVEIPSGGTLNEALLEAGLARTEERWPHSMLVRYAQAQQNARRHGKGIWGDG